MLLILEGHQRETYAHYFDEMFALRHQIFIQGLGWNLPASLSEKEIDQYDVGEAVYLVDINDDDQIQGTVRLAPSETCSLVADSFSHLVEGDIKIRSPDVYEATRYIFRPLCKKAHENRAAKARLLSGMLELCRMRSVGYVQGIVDLRDYPGWLELVPQTIPLGLPHPYGGGRGAPGGGECIAFRWPASHETIQGIRAYGRLGAIPIDFLNVEEGTIQQLTWH